MDRGWTRGIVVLSAPVDNLVLEHGVRDGQTATNTKVQHQNTRRVQIQKTIPHNHCSPGLTGVAHMRIEVPQ